MDGWGYGLHRPSGTLPNKNGYDHFLLFSFDRFQRSHGECSDRPVQHLHVHGAHVVWVAIDIVGRLVVGGDNLKLLDQVRNNVLLQAKVLTLQRKGNAGGGLENVNATSN